MFEQRRGGGRYITQPRSNRLTLQAARRDIEHVLGGIQNRAIAGAAAQIASQRIGQVAAGWGLGTHSLGLIGGPHRHHKTRCAKTALRAMVVHHRLLNRVQRAPPQGFQKLHGEDCFAMQARYKSQAGIDGAQLQSARRGVVQCAHHHGARPTVAFVTPLLGAGVVGVFAQPVEHGSGWRATLQLDRLTVLEKTKRLRLWLGRAHKRATFKQFGLVGLGRASQKHAHTPRPPPPTIRRQAAQVTHPV